MNEIDVKKHIQNMLDDIEKEYDAKVVRDNVKDLKGIKKLVSSYPVSALLDINPASGRIITDSSRTDIEITYNHKKKALKYCVKNLETWKNMTLTAHINFRETLMNYMEIQEQDNL